MKQSRTLYDQIIEVTTNYLGPAAKRFIDRQISAHLNKEPSKLTKNDLNKLVVWMEAVVPLLTKDEKVVEAYINELENLSGRYAQRK